MVLPFNAQVAKSFTEKIYYYYFFELCIFIYLKNKYLIFQIITIQYINWTIYMNREFLVGIIQKQ